MAVWGCEMNMLICMSFQVDIYLLCRNSTPQLCRIKYVSILLDALNNFITGTFRFYFLQRVCKGPRSKSVKRPRYEQKFKLQYSTSFNSYGSHVRVKVTHFVYCVDVLP